MTIDELIDSLNELKKENPNCGTFKVILQKDSEGNGYSPLSGLEEVFYIPENSWKGDVISIDENLDEYGYDEDELEDAVVLWPIN